MTRYVALAALLVLASVSWADDGAVLFEQNCALCHQSGGVGLAGQFPRLAGRIAALSTEAKGRAYLIDVLTYGMSGTVTVDGQPLFGLMPPFAQLPDGTVADILSYVQTLGDPQPKLPAPFTPAEIAKGRRRPAKTADEVHAERQALQASKILE